jgi:hypothetical protein
MLVFFSCANAKDPTYIGSTPANNSLVRSFLQIPLADSVDFIRWKLSVGNDEFVLNCNYGIGKPNTNGFMQGGKCVELTGSFKKEKNLLFIQSGNRSLAFAQLNESLLHLVDEKNRLLVGTGGWSWTLNNESATPTDHLNIERKSIALPDSITFQGRTPCLDFADKRSPNCYKMKWLITLYTDSKDHQPASYSLRETAIVGKSMVGTWTTSSAANGRIVYKLNANTGKPLYFLMLDENLLALTNPEGRLLVGNEDFSYTLNRK